MAKGVEVYDILTHDGGRLVTCRKENGKVTVCGKDGDMSLMEFLELAVNPDLARQRKSRKPRKPKRESGSE